MEEDRQANGHIQHSIEYPRDGEDATSLAIRQRAAKKPDRERKSCKSDGSIELVPITILEEVDTRSADCHTYRPRMRLI